MLAVPLVTQLPQRSGAPLAPESSPGPGQWHQWLLAAPGIEGVDRHQRGNRAAPLGDDRWLTLLGRLKQLRELVPRLFRALAPCRAHLTILSPTVQYRTVGGQGAPQSNRSS